MAVVLFGTSVVQSSPKKKNVRKNFDFFSPNFLHTISMLVIMMDVCKHDVHCCVLTLRDFAWVGCPIVVDSTFFFYITGGAKTFKYGPGCAPKGG